MRHLWRAGRTLFVILLGAVLALAVVSPARAVVASAPAIAVQQGTASAYDAVSYAYDAPSMLSSQSAAASYVRGPPSGPAAVSWGQSAFVRDRGVAANTVDNILPTPQVSSTRLQNLVDNLYKGTTNPNRVGTGTTMDAIRSVMATGVPTEPPRLSWRLSTHGG